MPVTGESQSGNFMRLKGEICALSDIRGVRALIDDRNVDIIQVIRNGGLNGASSTQITELSYRLTAIETYLANLPPPQAASAAVVGQRGPPGESIEGPAGIQGPRGAPGAKTFRELTDVNLDGLDDGGIMVWSAKDKKWVVSLE